MPDKHVGLHPIAGTERRSREGDCYFYHMVMMPRPFSMLAFHLRYGKPSWMSDKVWATLKEVSEESQL